MAGVAIISAFYITNNAPCQKGGTLSYFFLHGALLLARNARNVALSFDINRRR